MARWSVSFRLILILTRSFCISLCFLMFIVRRRSSDRRDGRQQQHHQRTIFRFFSIFEISNITISIDQAEGEQGDARAEPRPMVNPVFFPFICKQIWDILSCSHSACWCLLAMMAQLNSDFVYVSVFYWSIVRLIELRFVCSVVQLMNSSICTRSDFQTTKYVKNISHFSTCLL